MHLCCNEQAYVNNGLSSLLGSFCDFLVVIADVLELALSAFLNWFIAIWFVLDIILFLLCFGWDFFPRLVPSRF